MWTRELFETFLVGTLKTHNSPIKYLPDDVIYTIYEQILWKDADEQDNIISILKSSNPATRFESVCKMGSIYIAQIAYEFFPEEFTTISYAAKYGHLHLVVWMLEEEICTFYPYDSADYHPEIIMWLHMNGYEFSRYMILKIANSGNFELLDWLYNRRFVEWARRIKFDRNMLDNAVVRNDLPLAKWVYEHFPSQLKWKTRCEIKRKGGPMYDWMRAL